MFTLNIDGITVEHDYEPDDTLRVQLEDLDTSNGYYPPCRNCGENMYPGVDGWVHEEDDSVYCDMTTDPGERRIAEPPPLHWCNSAAITLDPDGNAVHVSISAGDPRGAFVMTVRQLPDGQLVLHQPYPGEPMPHMTTVELYPGTLAIK